MCKFCLFVIFCVVFIATITCTLLLFVFVNNEEKKIKNECAKLDIDNFPSLDVHCFYNNVNISCNEKIIDGTLVYFTCKSTYESTLMPYNTIECVNGNWSQPLLNCERELSHSILIREVNLKSISPKDILRKKNHSKGKCKELFSTSLHIKCFYENTTTSCDDPMLHNTIAKLECKDSYQHDLMPYTEIHCVNGSWNNPLFNCKPVCGKRASKASPLAIHGVDADIGDFPWHVGLYKKIRKKSKIKYLYNCGGSIISPKLIITAAHCFLELEPWKYQIAAGKVYRRFLHKKDQNAQYRDVVDIHISNKYDGYLNGFTADIAILVLSDVLMLSNLVQPACLDYNRQFLDFDKKKIGEVPGWGKVSENGSLSDYLQYLSLPLKSYKECKENVPEDFLPYVTFDKICAGYSNGTSVCTGDSGGGLVYEKVVVNNEKEYYLVGIVSTSPFKDDSCDSSKYTTFTNIALHSEWINNTIFKYESWTPYDYGCKLPEPPTFGNYTIEMSTHEDINLMPGNLVPQYTKLQYFCFNEYEVHGDKIITCKEKRWSVNNFFPMCFRKCLVFDSPEHEIEYSSKNINGYYLHETQAFYRCFNSNYELEATGYNQTTCRDGKWTKPLLNCIPICGIARQTPASHILNETYAYPGQYPWLVGVYFLIDSDNYLMECAGAIISPFIVIISTYDDIIDDGTFIVVAGNTHYSFKNNLDKNTQQSFVYRIMLLTSGISKRSHGNQYILILKTPLKMTSFVHPVCLSLTDRVITDVNTIAEMPMWIENDENLRSLKFKLHTLNKKLKKTIPANGTVPLSTIYVVPVLTSELRTRYFFMGYGVYNEKIISILTTDKIMQIYEISQKYNIKADVMSECIMPDVPSYARIISNNYRPGEVVPETTKIQYNCQLSSYDFYISKESICKNSSWNQPNKEPFCVVCGMSELQNNSEIISPYENYYTSKNKDFPWHVGIYDKSYKIPELFCSGTIISSKIILTYFDCFVDYIVNIFDKTKFAIGAGKLYNNWDNNLDTQAQFADINDIIFNDNRYRLLVAAVLKKSLRITSYVLPVCLGVSQLTEVQTESFNEIIPVWTHEKINGDQLKYLQFTERTQKEFILYKNSSFPCEKYEDMRGSSSVIGVKINNKNNYIIKSVVRNSRCSQLVFVDLHDHVNWLVSIIKNNIVE